MASSNDWICQRFLPSTGTTNLISDALYSCDYLLFNVGNDQIMIVLQCSLFILEIIIFRLSREKFVKTNITPENASVTDCKPDRNELFIDSSYKRRPFKSHKFLSRANSITFSGLEFIGSTGTASGFGYLFNLTF